MKNHYALLCCFLSLVLVSGCSKKSASQNAAASKSAASTAAAPAATSANPPADAASADASAKMAAADWAMKQDEIKNDPNGQWAIQATASSSYNDAQGTAPYSANQVTGPPNVDTYSDNGAAWAPKTADGGIEWVDLKYPRPVHASEIRVRESCGSGAVVKIEIFDEQNTAHAVWQGNDPTKELNYLIATFPKTTFKTARVKITLATNVVPGWNEIDAVQLVGTDQ